MTWLIALFAVQALADVRATIVSPVVLRAAQVNSDASPRVRACDADQPPQCQVIVFDLP